MSAPPRHWPIFDNIRRWYRNWSLARKGASELQCAGGAEVERIARDLGLSSFELRALVMNSDERELLRKRMATLHIDATELGRSEPATMRDLQRVCAMCGFKYRCSRDLAVEALDPSWQEWRDYCPNATTLSTLGALQICSEARRGSTGNDASLHRGDPAHWE
jgi:hypothetical protein